MSEPVASSSAALRSSTPAALLTLSGLGAAFGLASCCALPLALYSLGLGTAWLAGIALFALTHSRLLLAVSLIGLIGGTATLLWDWRRLHGPTRWVMVGGLLVGSVLLWAGLTYA